MTAAALFTAPLAPAYPVLTSSESDFVERMHDITQSSQSEILYRLGDTGLLKIGDAVCSMRSSGKSAPYVIKYVQKTYRLRPAEASAVVDAANKYLCGRSDR